MDEVKRILSWVKSLPESEQDKLVDVAFAAGLPFFTIAFKAFMQREN
jgi:hypothetical protein